MTAIMMTMKKKKVIIAKMEWTTMKREMRIPPMMMAGIV